MRRGKPNDPERRARILQATLEVIGEHGVAGVSYRGVAAHAGVPLGSMTYYFPTLEGLIVDAFDSTRGHLEPRYAAPLREARAPSDVVDALVEATLGSTSPSLDDIRLYLEVRHYGARNTRVAAVLQAVEDDALEMLDRVMPRRSAITINAMLWGWWSHRLAHNDTGLDRETVRHAFAALCAIPAPDHAFHTKGNDHA